MNSECSKAGEPPAAMSVGQHADRAISIDAVNDLVISGETTSPLNTLCLLPATGMAVMNKLGMPELFELIEKGTAGTIDSLAKFAKVRSKKSLIKVLCDYLPKWNEPIGREIGMLTIFLGLKPEERVESLGATYSQTNELISKVLGQPNILAAGPDEIKLQLLNYLVTSSNKFLMEAMRSFGPESIINSVHASVVSAVQSFRQGAMPSANVALDWFVVGDLSILSDQVSLESWRRELLFSVPHSCRSPAMRMGRGLPEEDNAACILRYHEIQRDLTNLKIAMDTRGPERGAAISKALSDLTKPKKKVGKTLINVETDSRPEAIPGATVLVPGEAVTVHIPDEVIPPATTEQLDAFTNLTGKFLSDEEVSDDLIALFFSGTEPTGALKSVCSNLGYSYFDLHILVNEGAAVKDVLLALHHFGPRCLHAIALQHLGKSVQGFKVSPAGYLDDTRVILAMPRPRPASVNFSQHDVNYLISQTSDFRPNPQSRQMLMQLASAPRSVGGTSRVATKVRMAKVASMLEEGGDQADKAWSNMIAAVVTDHFRKSGLAMGETAIALSTISNAMDIHERLNIVDMVGMESDMERVVSSISNRNMHQIWIPLRDVIFDTEPRSESEYVLHVNFRIVTLKVPEGYDFLSGKASGIEMNISDILEDQTITSFMSDKALRTVQSRRSREKSSGQGPKVAGTLSKTVQSRSAPSVNWSEVRACKNIDVFLIRDDGVISGIMRGLRNLFPHLSAALDSNLSQNATLRHIRDRKRREKRPKPLTEEEKEMLEQLKKRA